MPLSAAVSSGPIVLAQLGSLLLALLGRRLGRGDVGDVPQLALVRAVALPHVGQRPIGGTIRCGQAVAEGIHDEASPGSVAEGPLLASRTLLVAGPEVHLAVLLVRLGIEAEPTGVPELPRGVVKVPLLLFVAMHTGPGLHWRPPGVRYDGVEAGARLMANADVLRADLSARAQVLLPEAVQHRLRAPARRAPARLRFRRGLGDRAQLIAFPDPDRGAGQGCREGAAK
mmetsp:Transcript_23975/g.71341  ORF Transcript_23975/g.71341 Transcript_23975/m.71341 type:complete len:228 (+) Transcript_23975:178-861(+)